MNRKLMLGIAGFFAVLGLALMGAENEAIAGRSCHGGGLFGGGLLARHQGGCHGGLLGGLRKHCSGVAAPVCPAPAPSCSGGRKSCHGGLLARLHARKAARKACCGTPEPVCCPAPAPACCEPAPAPVCCEPAPAPACCEAAPAPCCGSAPVAEAPCCGGGEVISGEVAAPVSQGEQIVEGSVQVINDGASTAAPATPTPADAVPEAPAAAQ